MNTVDIALPLPKNKNFSYLLPDNIRGSGHIGKRVLVPFGKRLLTGVVVNESESENIDKLRYINELLDETPVFSTAMLEFTKWVAEYYMCSWGETLKAALPSGMSPKSVLKISLLKELDDQYIENIRRKAPKRAAVLSYLMEHKGNISINHLENILKSKSLHHQIEALEEMGIIKVERFLGEESKSKYLRAIKLHHNLNEDETIKIINLIQKKAPKQAVLLSKLLNIYQGDKNFILLRDVLKQFKISTSVVKELDLKNHIEYIDVEIDRTVQDIAQEKLSDRNEIDLNLTEEQSKSLQSIIKSINNEHFESFLLHGITGSGKTLVYLHSIKYTLDKGKSALILVPEISLTPQLIDRFENSFPEQVAVFHSRMSQGERYDSWKSIISGGKKVILGVRSAIFTPVKNIGLIIVDEEHEHSYKQESPEPRYNARDIAVIRAKMENAIIVLGSATPSLESMYNTSIGKYNLLKLTHRADKAVLPSVNIIDIRESRKKGLMNGSLSKELLDAITERINRKEGVILFQNRRGFATVLECPDCGFIPECDNCSVPLTYHKSKDRLHCHYCGTIYKISKSCPACGFHGLKELGYGTQRIEDTLNEYLSENNIKASIARMDLDTTSQKGSHRKLLLNFSKGETDILIGTQMVAKGIDIARVSLVGIINADLQLFIPDFRASERTFQLLTQVAGRAGRTSGISGEVYIQTSHPENFAVKYAKSHNYEEFFKEEIIHRKTAGYPPFSRFSVIEFSGPDKNLVEQFSDKLFRILPKSDQALEILGPVEPSLYKLRGNFRRVIIIKADKSKDPSGRKMRYLINYTMDIYNSKFANNSVRVKIDMDSYMSI